MANNLVFTDAQRNALVALAQQYAATWPQNDNTSVSSILKDAYDLINAAIQERLLTQSDAIDEETQLFFRLAVEVNQNVLTSPANFYIRTATRTGLVETPGGDSRESAIQRTSNRIAFTVLQDLALRGSLPTSVNDLIRQDVTEAVTRGGQTWGGWAGALFYMTPRVGPQEQSIAKMIFSSAVETDKFQFTTTHALITTRRQFTYGIDFIAARKQAFRSSWAIILEPGSDLNDKEKKIASRTLGTIGLVFLFDVFVADAGSLETEIANWIPVDDLLAITNSLPRGGAITVEVPNVAGVESARAIHDALKTIATALPISYIRVSDANQTSAAYFGSSGGNFIAGTGAANTIFGNDGSDVLIAGAGSDVLDGGDGTDTYVFRGRDHNERVIDSDRRGRIVFDDAAIAGTDQERIVAAGLFIETQTGTWTSPDGRVTLTHASPFTLHAGNANIDLGENFQSGDFGIRLISAPTAPQNPVRTFFGDKQDWDSDPDVEGIQPQGDGFGNSIRADGQGRVDIAEPNRADLFFGAESTEVERFITAGGDDTVYADGISSATSSIGGRDLIETGTGRDIVVAGAGDDWVEGGTEADILSGNAGNDALYAQTSNGQTLPIQQAITAGETEARSLEAGELLTGDAGRDMLFGAATDDLLLGGESEDIVVGGGGDDTVYGDLSVTTADRGWTIQRTVTVQGGITRYAVTGQNVTFLTPGVELGAADAIYAGAGMDWVFAGAGDDYIETGNDNDVAFGEAGADVLIGGAGDDVLSGDNTLLVFGTDEGADYLDGGAGNDTLNGDGNDDIIYGGAGDDYLGGGTGADILNGGPGLDVLVGGAGKDTYIFNRGDGREDIFDPSAGADDPNASVLVLGEGISRDDITLRLGSLTIDLGNADSLHFAGFDALDPLSTPLLDSIQFADGTAMSYQDVLDRGFDIDGTEGDDVIDGTAVTDRIDAKGGNDVVSGRPGDDSIIGGAGNDVLLGEFGNDTLSGGEGVDSLDGDYGDDVLAGNEGDDELFAGDGRDVLDGGAGDDSLVADSGNDSLSGGTGNDVLQGNEGSDVYTFSVGDGRDTVDEQAILASNLVDTVGIDVIGFSAGIAPPDVTLAARGNGDLIIRYGVDDQVTVRGQYRISGNAIERIEFADGTVLDSAALNAVPILPIEGTAGDDGIYGTDGNDTLLGFAGNDVLDGGLAPDGERSPALLTDNDRLEGGAGADTYAMYLGMGTDAIVDASASPAEIGTLKLAAGLTVDSVRTQRRADDLFVGLRSSQEGALITGYYDAAAPAQNWQVMTDDGATTPIEDVINRPDPNADDIAAAAREDYKQNLLSSWSVLSQSAQLPTHALVFDSYSQTVRTLTDVGAFAPRSIVVDPPVTSQSIAGFGTRRGGAFATVVPFQTQVTPVFVSQVKDDAVIQTQGNPTSSEQELLYRATVGAVARNVSGSVSTTGSTSVGQIGGDPVIIESTTTTSTNESWRNVTLTPDPGAPLASSFRLFQRTEERVIEEITAGASDNQIQGVLGSTGTHVALIDVGSGHDNVNAGAFDFVYGNDGNDFISGGRIVYGGNGDDLLQGGTNLNGGAGNDILIGGQAVLAGGTGDDFMNGASGLTRFVIDPTEPGEDFIQDAGGIEPTLFDDRYYQSLGIAIPAEHRDFGDMWVVLPETPTAFAIESAVRPEGYQSLSIGEDPYIPSSDTSTHVYLTLDDLRTELGVFGVSYRPDDIRYIEPLPPAPVVTANDYAALEPFYAAGLIELDTVQFGEGISLEDVIAFTDVNGALTLTWGEAKIVHVTLPTATDLIGTGIERFKFSDATTVSLAEMLARTGPVPLPTIIGTEGDDFLVGTFESERILGLGGNDELVGLEGNDELDGGPGNDFLQGGEGDDTYLFNQGDGADFISDEGGTDAVRFAGDIAPEDVLVTTDLGGALILTLPTGDGVVLSEWFSETARIENVEFADGTIWDAAELETRITVAPATEFDDLLIGSANDDTIDGLGGSDEIYGQSGNDVLEGGIGDDYVEGNAGSDILRGGEGADSLADWEGNNFLEGGAGDDNLYADGRPNFVDGGASLVIGGAGNDWVNSYAAGNVIAFNAGDGQDTVYAANALTLSLGDGIDPAALSLSQDGTDLVLAIGANDSIRLTRQFEPDPQAWPQITLQMFGSVHFYDFNAVISDFRQAVAADPLLQQFALQGALQAHQTAVSETQALGGALAHQYATTGNLNGLSDTAIWQALSDPDFGFAPQTIQIQGANQAPVLANAIADQFATEDAAFSFVVPANTFGDSDLGDTLSYSATRADGSVLPTWLSFNAITRTFSGTPTNDEAGTISVMITATDTGNLSAFNTFDVTVANTNDAPVAVADSVAVNENATTSNLVPLLLANDTDVDVGDTRSITAVGTVGTVGAVSFDLSTQMLTYSADAAAQDALAAGATATDQFTYTIADAQGASSSAIVSVTVSGMNDGPILANGIADQSATEDAAFSFNVPAGAFSDVDLGDVLGYSATRADGTALPFWLTFDATTRSFSGTPLNADVGTISVQVTATDTGELSASDTFDVTVVNTNDAPMVANAITVQTAVEDAAFSFQVPANTFADVDVGDALTFSATLANSSALPSWLSFDAVSRTFSGTPVNADVGAVSVRVTATDGSNASVSDVFDLAVANTNEVPVAVADSVAVNEDATTANLAPLLLANDTDVDAGDTRSITAINTTGMVGTVAFNAPMQTLTYSADAAAQDALAAGATATDQFSYTVADAAGATAQATVTVTATGVNDAPVLATPIADQNANENQAFSFQVPGASFSDIDVGDTLAYSATLANGVPLPSWLSFDLATRTFTGTPGPADIGDVSVQVVASDQAGAQAADEFNLSVALLSGGVTLTGTSGQDTLVGGAGADTISGLAGADQLYGNEGPDLLNGGDGADQLFGWTGNDTLNGGAGADTMFGDEGTDALYGELGADTLWGGVGNDTLDGGDGGDTLRGEAGEDLLYGDIGADNLYGGIGNDYLSGGLGGDQLFGEDGIDVMQGGDGADSLFGHAGNDLLQARLGGDTLDGDVGNDFLAAGGGADTIKPGAGHDVMAFNRGDGADTVQAAGGPEDTVSVGGGVRYQDLTLSKSNNDLVLDAGSGDRLTFKDWYAATTVRPALNLQVIAEAMVDFNPASSDPLLNRKVQMFDFQDVFGAFEAARAANPALTSWALTNALLDFHLSGSDTEALGGDLAYQYGKNGGLTGISLNSAQDIMGGAQFGAQAQALRPLASLQEGLVKLS